MTLTPDQLQALMTLRDSISNHEFSELSLYAENKYEHALDAALALLSSSQRTREVNQIDMHAQKAGTIVAVTTKNTVYTITCREMNTSTFSQRSTRIVMTIQGHKKYCPVDVQVTIHGSLANLTDCSFVDGRLTVGEQMLFTPQGHEKLITTPIQLIVVSMLQ